MRLTIAISAGESQQPAGLDQAARGHEARPPEARLESVQDGGRQENPRKSKPTVPSRPPHSSIARAVTSSGSSVSSTPRPSFSHEIAWTLVISNFRTATLRRAVAGDGERLVDVIAGGLVAAQVVDVLGRGQEQDVDPPLRHACPHAGQALPVLAEREGSGSPCGCRAFVIGGLLWVSVTASLYAGFRRVVKGCGPTRFRRAALGRDPGPAHQLDHGEEHHRDQHEQRRDRGQRRVDLEPDALPHPFGKVVVAGPPRKIARITSSKDTRKAKAAPEITAGSTAGKVTCHSVRK